jgi:hypothetical protein
MSLLNEASFLVTPNGYKEDKLYAAIPTTGDGDMTFTRAGTATRVNESGLIELVPYNLLSRSEDFSNAPWTKGNVTLTPNSTTAPDGTLTATRVVNTSSLNVFNSDVLGSFSGTYTFSFYAKSNGGTQNYIGIWDRYGIGSETVSRDFTNELSTTEWRRISISITVGSGSSRLYFYLTRDQTIGTVDFYAWGAQLVEGSSAKTYQKTVDRLDIPRIDYTGGGCPSILLEPQRTNLVTNSAYTASWVSNSNTTPNIVLGADIAPDGTQTAMNIPFGATGYAQSNKTTPADTLTYTASFYAKSITGTGIIGTGTFGFAFGSYVVGTIFNFATLQAGSQWTATAVGNGWYRLSISLVNTNQTIFIFRLDSALTTANNVMFWGAQLEAGAYPTSYIPTTTGTVTRNADAISKTGISDLLNPSEGTFYAEISALANDLTNRMLSLSDGTGDNTVQIRFSNASNQIRLDIYGQSAVYRSLVTVLDITENHKVLIKWGASGIFGFIDGDKYTFFLAIGTGSGIPTALNRINFNNWSGAAAFYGKCKGVQIYKTALSDPQCKALTTL